MCSSDLEIRVDSGNGCRELRGKRVPIIIRNLRNIYIQNIQAKHTYQWASNAKEFPTIDDASRDIRYLYQSLVSNIFYCLPWAIALPQIGITPDTAWTYHKWVLWVDYQSFACILLLLTKCIIDSGGSLVVSLGIITFVDGLWALRLCGWRVSRKERTWVFRRTTGGVVSWLLLIFRCCVYAVHLLSILCCVDIGGDLYHSSIYSTDYSNNALVIYITSCRLNDNKNGLFYGIC